MSQKAIKDIYTITLSIAAAAIAATTNGIGVSMAGSIENLFCVTPGVKTDGALTPKLQESVDNVNFTDVAAANQVGAFGPIASNVPQKVSYIGIQPYVRVVLTVVGATTGAVVSAFALTKPHRQPAP